LRRCVFSRAIPSGQRRQDRHPLYFQLLRRGYPRLKAARTNTQPLENISPNSMPSTIISAFRGFMGSGCVTAESMIRTFPIALEREILSSLLTR
jgi:hypothetical protein